MHTTPHSRPAGAVAVLVLATVLGSACRDDGANTGTQRVAPATTARSASTDATGATATTVPLVAADSGSSPEWNSYGHDLANTRRNAEETKVTAATVKGLHRGWSLDGLVGVTGTPAVVDGVAYFGDWKGVVHAVDATSGAPRWTTAIGGMFVGAPAVDGDGVFVAVGVTLSRLDRATGKVVWKV